jgi:competence protein ComEC
VSVADALNALRRRWWAFADAERQSLALWLPVAFAAGIGLWFVLPWQSQRLALACKGAAEWRSARVAAPVLAFRQMALVLGRIEAVENRQGRGKMRRGLALSHYPTLHWLVKIIAVGGAALAGVAYTLLAGAEVPTVQTIIATLIVLVGVVIGREAFSLRLLAAAAMLILAVRPEALLGPSFQLGFAVVIAIVALYESRVGQWLTTPGEGEGWPRRLLRNGLALLVSELVAELALSSIGLFHFNRAGLYGFFANMIAIPLSSFVIMPLLMLVLLADPIGLGSLVCPAVGWAMGLLISLAETTAALPGAVVRMPSIAAGAFALIITGGLGLALWRSRVRWWGLK